MEKEEVSTQEENMEDSDFDTSLVEEETASGSENVLRKRVTFEVSEESESEARQKKSTTESTADKGSSMGTVLVVLTLVFVVLSSVGFYFSNLPDDDHNAEWVIEQLGKNLRIVRTRFASQSQNLWSDLYLGVEKVLLEYPREPYVFLLVHQGSDATASCLARQVGGIAHALIGASERELLTLDGATLTKNKEFSGDETLFARKYRPLVERHRVVSLKNVQLIPGTTAKRLQVFCNTGTQSPFVDQAMYVLTLKVPDGQGGGNVKALAEKVLHSAWSDASKDDVRAAIHCLTSGTILWIEPEKRSIDGC